MIDQRLTQYMYRGIDPTKWYPLENSRIMFNGREVMELIFPPDASTMFVRMMGGSQAREYPTHSQTQFVVWTLQLALVLADRDLAISLAEEVTV